MPAALCAHEDDMAVPSETIAISTLHRGEAGGFVP
jgi:hypothetical protein